MRDVLAWAGGIQPAKWSQRTGQDYAVVCGGPMMGQLPDSLDQPVTKMTSGLLVLPRDNVVVRYLTAPGNRGCGAGSRPAISAVTAPISARATCWATI